MQQLRGVCGGGEEGERARECRGLYQCRVITDFDLCGKTMYCSVL